MSMRPLSYIGLSLLSALSATADDFFEQRIRPVLIEHCFTCHSAQASDLKGGLLLDSPEALLKGGASGQPAVVPGDAAASRIIRALRYDDPHLQMPPKEALPPQVVDDFTRWVDSGAAYPAALAPVDIMAKARDHWAFKPPTPQQVPVVQNQSWARTEVDRFVLAKLEAVGLSPSPEADKRTLIRRLAYDLLGLPPTPEEVQAFESDPDPAAYEKLVDRYLSSPHYGERWARHWLDVARYADTKGYVYTNREAVDFTNSHTYRDWVVNALNRDMPYDQFIRLQIAADKLTDETTRTDRAAMGFLTLGPRFLGVMPDIIDDRIDTLTRGLLGLTVSCARCHDHKFDPIPTADYYSLYGVFSASSERTELIDPAAIEKSEYAEFKKGLAEKEAKLRDRFAAKTLELEERLRAQVDRYLASVPDANKLPTDDFYEIRNAEDINPTIVRRWGAFIERRGVNDSIFGLWNKLAALPAETFSRDLDALLAAEILDGEDEAAVDFPVACNPQVFIAFIELAPSSMAEVAAAYGALFKDVNDEWLRLQDEAKASAQPAPSALPDPDREAIRQLLLADDSPIRVPGGAIVDIEWMFDEPSRVELATLHAHIDRHIVAAKEAPEYAVVLNDKPEMSPPRIFLRGSTAMPGPEVPRQFLEILTKERTPFQDGSGRRELAEAIASPDNPLTARVIVNRVWAWHFGQGLVETTSDFGTRAAAPSHPELLDWLARYFIENGWSLKHLHRQLVVSAAYRQQSSPDGAERLARAQETDPENKLLWKFNAHRLDFESLRDSLLATSSKLDTAIGGRPVDLMSSTRRTLYAKVDRQFLPAVFRVFDYPNPDMHSPTRINTTVPQQALFLMNNHFVQDQARALAARVESVNEAARVDALYRAAYQREAEDEEALRASHFLQHAAEITPPPPPPAAPPAWSYGYGRFDLTSGKVTFTPLPHFTGSAWQGGSAWPDPALGWAQLTADGGHPGNDLDHAVIRRWTAEEAAQIDIEGRIKHARTEGDGIVARIVSSRRGVLAQWFLHNSESDTNLFRIDVAQGETIDFVVDIKEVLNSDEHLWSPRISLADASRAWDAKAEFAGPYEAAPVPLTPWEKLAQVVLLSNEFLFVD